MTVALFAESASLSAAATSKIHTTNCPRIKGRPATAADIAEFYPEMTSSFRAWVAEIDGVPQGIIGIALLRPIACMFSSFREVLRPYLRHPTILRLIKKAQAEMKASSVPVGAAVEPGEPESPKILTRLGFRPAGELSGYEIYVWVPGEVA